MIQGTNADIIKLAMWKMIEEIDRDKLPVKLLLSVYDEIQTECPKELAEYWKSRMNDIMIKAAEVVIRKVPVVVDCKISNCWEK